MKTLLLGLTAAVSFLATAVFGLPPSTESDGSLLILRPQGGPLSAPQEACLCDIIVGDAVNNTTTSCPAGTSGDPPFIQVTCEDKKGSKCKEDPTDCEPIEGNECSATVNAELQWPADPCISSGVVTGPGIGTDDSPCQPTAAPTNVEVSWSLSSPCTPSGSGGPAGSSFSFWANESCDNGQPPNSDPTLEYEPKLSCTACTKSDG